MNSPSWDDSHLKVGAATSKPRKSIRVTMSDIAELAGVSTATVSNVVNKKGKVSRATRERVKAAIRSTRGKPNMNARNLARTNRSRPSKKYISRVACCTSLKDSNPARNFWLRTGLPAHLPSPHLKVANS